MNEEAVLDVLSISWHAGVRKNRTFTEEKWEACLKFNNFSNPINKG